MFLKVTPETIRNVNAHKTRVLALAVLLAFMALFYLSRFPGLANFVSGAIAVMPFLVIILFCIYYFRDSRRYHSELNYLTQIYLQNALKILSFVLLLFILFSPSSWQPLLTFAVNFTRSFFNLESFFLLASYLAVIIVSGMSILFFIRLYQRSRGTYDKPAGLILKKYLYSTFFLMFFLLVTSVAAYPGAYAPITGTVADIIYTTFGFGPASISGNPENTSILSRLKKAVGETAGNLTGEIAKSNDQLAGSIAATKDSLTSSISQTADNLQNDINKKLSENGGTISGSLTLSGNDADLSVEGTTTTKDIVPDDTLTYNLGATGKSWNSLYIHRLIGSSPVFIGNESSGHGLANDGDLVISHDLEVKGTLYAASFEPDSLNTKALTINSAYDFPTADGTAGQVLKTNGAGTLAWGEAGVTPGGLTGQIQFNDSGTLGADADLFWDSSANRLGVGTDSPQSRVDVAGTVRATAFYLTDLGVYLNPNDVNSNYWTESNGDIYRETGNIGMGTDSPTEILDISGRIHLRQTAAPLVTIDKLYNAGGDLYWNGLKLGENFWDKIGHNAAFNLSGNVGIGVADPTAKLEVEGTVKAANFYDAANGVYLVPGDINGNYWGESGGDVYRETGKVGIGNSNPAALFSVGSSSQFQINSSGAVTAGTWNGTAIANANLANSTISGIALGSNLATLTFGTHLTGTSYNGGAAATIATDATNANTLSTIVARDASGNFSAGTITASLTGAASLNVLKAGDTMTGNLAFGANSFTTSNTTVIANLNADLLDGQHGSYYVAANGAITGATKTKITYDAKGLVTAGADATTADIADSSNKRYVTDAQLVILGNTSNTNSGDNAVNSLYSGLASSKQDTLISNSNIKTVNGITLLGSGDITQTTITGNAGTVTNGVYTTTFNGLGDARYLQLSGGTMTGGITNSTSVNPLTTLAESWIGPSSTTGIYFKGGNVGIGTTAPLTTLQVAKDFSTSANSGQIEAIGATNGAKRMTIGFDTTNNIGWIQPSETDVGYRNLALNPNGGNVGIGTTGPGGGTGSSVLTLANSSALPTALANTTHLYSSSGEGYWMDSAGNAALQTPHDLQTGKWIFSSTNVNTKRTLRVEMEDLTKDLDTILGGGYVFENGEAVYHGENIITSLQDSRLSLENNVSVQTQSIASLQLKTDENISTLTELQKSVDTQLETASTSLKSLSSRQDEQKLVLDDHETRIKAQEDLTSKLAEQMKQLDAANNSLVVLKAQFELLDSRVSLLETLMNFNSESHKLEISADAIFSGNLEINGLLQLGKFDEAPKCDTDNEGGTYYNKKEKHFYGCNGTDWLQLDEKPANIPEVLPPIPSNN